jgi:hypothetical protein
MLERHEQNMPIEERAASQLRTFAPAHARAPEPESRYAVTLTVSALCLRRRRNSLPAAALFL